MMSETQREHERQMDRERQRMHMERIERGLDESRRQAEKAEYNSPKQQQKRAEQNAFQMKGALVLVALVALFFLAFFLISPGALALLYGFKFANYSAPAGEYWAYATVISLTIFSAFYFWLKKFKKSLAIYLFLCVCASAVAFVAKIDNVRAVDFALEKFWPFQKTGEVLIKKSNDSADKTTRSNPAEPDRKTSAAEVPAVEGVTKNLLENSSADQANEAMRISPAESDGKQSTAEPRAVENVTQNLSGASINPPADQANETIQSNPAEQDRKVNAAEAL